MDPEKIAFKIFEVVTVGIAQFTNIVGTTSNISILDGALITKRGHGEQLLEYLRRIVIEKRP